MKPEDKDTVLNFLIVTMLIVLSIFIVYLGFNYHRYQDTTIYLTKIESSGDSILYVDKETRFMYVSRDGRIHRIVDTYHEPILWNGTLE